MHNATTMLRVRDAFIDDTEVGERLGGYGEWPATMRTGVARGRGEPARRPGGATDGAARSAGVQ